MTSQVLGLRGPPALTVIVEVIVADLSTETFLTVAAFSVYLGQATDVEIQVGRMMGQHVLLMLVPMGLGMLARQRREDFVVQRRTLLQRLSVVAMTTLPVAEAVTSAVK